MAWEDLRKFELESGLLQICHTPKLFGYKSSSMTERPCCFTDRCVYEGKHTCSESGHAQSHAMPRLMQEDAWHWDPQQAASQGITLVPVSVIQACVCETVNSVWTCPVMHQASGCYFLLVHFAATMCTVCCTWPTFQDLLSTD